MRTASVLLLVLAMIRRSWFDLLWVGNYEAEAIRPHALGHFRDLLLATAHHPAMLYYLNNETNTAPGSPSASADTL